MYTLDSRILSTIRDTDAEVSVTVILTHLLESARSSCPCRPFLGLDRAHVNMGERRSDVTGQQDRTVNVNRWGYNGMDS